MKSTIVSAKRDERGYFLLTLELGGMWLATYLPDGRLFETIWEPGEHLPQLDPAMLDRLYKEEATPHASSN